MPPVGGRVGPGSMPSGGLRRVDARAHEWMDQLRWGKLVHKLVQKVGPAPRMRGCRTQRSAGGLRAREAFGQRRWASRSPAAAGAATRSGNLTQAWSTGAAMASAKRPRDNSSEGPININVGGRLFTCTRATLCSQPASMLASMFDQDSAFGAHVVDKEGHIFIDRDGELFQYVLD